MSELSPITVKDHPALHTIAGPPHYCLGGRTQYGIRTLQTLTPCPWVITSPNTNTTSIFVSNFSRNLIFPDNLGLKSGEYIARHPERNRVYDKYIKSYLDMSIINLYNMYAYLNDLYPTISFMSMIHTVEKNYIKNFALTLGLEKISVIRNGAGGNFLNTYAGVPCRSTVLSKVDINNIDEVNDLIKLSCKLVSK